MKTSRNPALPPRANTQPAERKSLRPPSAATRGRRSLIAILQVTSGREVAARCRVHPPAVSKWASGLARPDARVRIVLAETYRIPVGAWDEPLTLTARTAQPRGHNRHGRS